MAWAFGLGAPASVIAAPVLNVGTSHHPVTSLVPAGSYARYEVAVSNVGSTDTESQITVDFSVPASLAVTAVTDEYERAYGAPVWNCTIAEDSRSVACIGLDTEGHYGGPLPIAHGTEGCDGIGSGTCRILATVKADSGGPPGVAVPTVTACGGGAAACGNAPDDPLEIVPFGFDVASFDGSILQENGDPATSAGSHPHTASVTFFATTMLDSEGHQYSTEDIRDAVIGLPPGVVNHPLAVPTCTQAQLLGGGTQQCPAESQVGTVTIFADGSEASTPDVPFVPLTTGAYNMETPRGTPALFAFNLFGALTQVYGRLRTDGDYGIALVGKNAPQTLPFEGLTLTVWGVPADPRHDSERFCPGAGFESPGCDSADSVDPRAFLSLPTSCGGPPETTLDLTSWANSVASAGFHSHMPGEPLNTISPAGCNALAFTPTLEARPTTNVADVPSGLDIGIHIPQSDDPEGTVTAHLRDSTIVLPRGFAINPASANGLEGCTVGQFDAAVCPDASRLGRAEIDTSLVEDPLLGSVFLAEPYDNPFKSLIGLYLVVEEPQSGVVVRLAGEATPDPVTGRLSATFERIPQLPFEDIEAHIFGGAGGVVRTPAVCGIYTTASLLTPWSAPEAASATPSDTYAIQRSPAGGVCPASEDDVSYAPSLDAGTLAPIAGASTPFVLELRREAGTQALGSLDLTLPPGLTATLDGVTQCGERVLTAIPSAAGTAKSEADHPSCPAASRVGAVTVGAGAGPRPLFLGGAVYLGGPYEGAPMSLAVVVPVLAGPFDLGTTVVRIGLHVNPWTAQLRLESDPLPRALSGIPLDLRELHVRIDRPGFVRNPTSCNPSQITAATLSAAGLLATLTNRFQVGGCAVLGFKPRVAIHVSGGFARNAHPKIDLELTPRAADANIADAAFTLPAGELLDTRRIRGLCDASLPPESCPAHSRLGWVRLFSPILERPLEGSVYMRTQGRRLPGLLADLQSGRFQVLLRGHTAAPRGRLRVRFPSLPDIPISKALFTLAGGREGIFVNSHSLCAAPRRASIALGAHNGGQRLLRPLLRLRGHC